MRAQNRHVGAGDTPCGVLDCPAFAESGRFCRIHSTCEPAPYGGICPKCRKAYRGGRAGDSDRDLVVRIRNAKPGDEFVHAVCPPLKPRHSKKHEPKALIEAIEAQS
jgi:hypothetical protein